MSTARETLRVPDGLGLREAAALLHDGPTALRLADGARADVMRLAERALSEAAAGRLRPVIGQTFPLERAADAHAAIEARGVIGKTLLLL